MPKQFKVLLYWPPRTDDVSRMSDQLQVFLRDIGRLHPSLRAFHLADNDGNLTPAITPMEIRRALTDSVVDWATGNIPRKAYSPRLVLERDVAPPVEFTLTCGIEPMNLGDIFTPNRLELFVRSNAPAAEKPGVLLDGILRAGVDAFGPAWGCVGADDVPQSAVPIFSNGEPSVGWMLYLANGYPALPTLPNTVTVDVLHGLGTIITTVQDVFDPRNTAHREALRAVESMLMAAGVLRRMV